MSAIKTVSAAMIMTQTVMAKPHLSTVVTTVMTVIQASTLALLRFGMTASIQTAVERMISTKIKMGMTPSIMAEQTATIKMPPSIQE